MPRDADALNLEHFARNGIKQPPEDVGISWDSGWPLVYAQQGSGRYPEVRVFQQLLASLTALFQHRAALGVSDWSNRIDYPQDATTRHNRKFWIALTDNRGVTPGTDETVWKEWIRRGA